MGRRLGIAGDPILDRYSPAQLQHAGYLSVSNPTLEDVQPHPHAGEAREEAPEADLVHLISRADRWAMEDRAEYKLIRLALQLVSCMLDEPYVAFFFHWSAEMPTTQSFRIRKHCSEDSSYIGSSHISKIIPNHTRPTKSKCRNFW